MKYDVISIGSASMDTFLTSKSSHLEIAKHHKQEVCMPIGSKILVNELHSDAGGSGINSAISLSRLGFKTGTVSKIGNDMNARMILERLKKEKVDFLGSKGKGTTGCSIILSHLKGNRTILSYKGSNDNLGIAEVKTSRIITSWLYLGTMLEKSWKTECELARIAKRKGARILFNPSLYLAEKGKKYLEPVLKLCSILILNKEEAAELAGVGEMKSTLKKLQRIVPTVVITDGPKGAFAYDGNKQYYAPAKRVKVEDTTGAGDAFSSAFLASTMLGNNIRTALKWGAVQAGSVIQHYGATNKLLSRKELAREAEG